MDKTFQFRDITGFYTDEGSGNVVMLIHGFCEDGSVWDDLKIELSKTHRVIVPDLPGYRNTSLTKQELSMEWMASFVHAILEQEKVVNPMIIGHSMGGYITLALTEAFPLLPSKIGLFHSHAFADDDEKKKNRQKAVDFVEKNGAEEFVSELYDNLFAEKFKKEHAEVVASLKKYAKNHASQTVIAGLKAMKDRSDRTHVLKSFNRPVLFILGKEDKAIPYEKSLLQIGLPEIASVHILNQVGHMGMFEAPEKTLEMVQEFTNLSVPV